MARHVAAQSAEDNRFRRLIEVKTIGSGRGWSVSTEELARCWYFMPPRAAESNPFRARPTLSLGLSGIGDLQHLHFLAAVMSPVHVKGLGIAVHDLPHCAMLHLSSARLIVLTF